MASEIRTFTVGIFGAGVVAGGVVNILREKREQLAAAGIAFEISKICCRDLTRERDFELDPGTVKTDNPRDILEDESIDMIVELIGGVDTAKDIVFSGLGRGKLVVTANKALLAEHLHEVIAHCRIHDDSRLGFEAAVAGGIPIIRTLQQSLDFDTVEKIAGILNGTTNFMLSAMDSDGVSYDTILKQAQEAGYAEANPSADVDGFDARAKIVLLTKLAFGLSVDVEEVPTTGITAITSADFEAAKAAGCTIKLLGVSEPAADGKLAVYVTPALVPLSNPVGKVSGATNIVQVQSKSLGSSSYIGAGAGRAPTANSVVADMVNMALGTGSVHPFPKVKSEYTGLTSDYTAPWFIRTSPSEPATAVRDLGAIAADFGVPITSITLGSSCVINTSEAPRSAIMAFAEAASKICSAEPVVMPFYK